MGNSQQRKKSVAKVKRRTISDWFNASKAKERSGLFSSASALSINTRNTLTNLTGGVLVLGEGSSNNSANLLAVHDQRVEPSWAKSRSHS